MWLLVLPGKQMVGIGQICFLLLGDQQSMLLITFILCIMRIDVIIACLNDEENKILFSDVTWRRHGHA